MRITSRAAWSLLAICILLMAQSFGYASAEGLTIGGMLLAAGVGDIEDISKLLEKQGRTFDEFKQANDVRLSALESKGYAPADVVEKVDKINTDLGQQSKEIGELMKKLNRKNVGGSDSELNQDQQEHKASFENYFRKGTDNGLRDLERKALNTGSDPDGGYLVPTEIETMIDRVATADVAMRRLATVRQIGAASYKKPVVTTGAAGGWLGETEDSIETAAPKLSELEFNPGKLYAYPWATNDMLEDGVINIEQWLTQEVEEIFVEKEGEAFITGTGIKKPKGILAYDTVANSSYTWGKLGYVPSGASGAFHTDEGDALINLVHGLKRKYRNGAAWLMNDLTMAGVRKIKDAE